MSLEGQIHGLVARLEKERAEWESIARVCEDGSRYLTEDLERSRSEVKVLRKTVKQRDQEIAQLKEQLRLLESQVKKEEDNGCQVENVNGNKIEIEGKRRSPMAVFPEEIWSMIFDNLKGTADLKSCSNVCVKFQEMLEPQRTVFLFEDVLKIINSSKVQSYRDSSSPAPLAKCRGVCKAWKKAVENRFLETNPIFPDYSPDTNSNALLFSYSNYPWQYMEIRNLPQNQNPMTSHYLVYSGFQDPNIFLDFLRKFGQHVWYFKVELGRWDYEWSSNLCSFVALMPNLKGLHLVKLNENHFFFYHDRFSCYYDRFISDFNSDAKFPTISTMTALYFEDCEKQVVEAILKVNPQVQQLKIDYKTYGGLENYDDDLDPLSLRNLTELSLYCFGWAWTLLCSSESCPLRKLTVKSIEASWQDLLQDLEDNFADTLVELHLELSGAGRQRALRVNLPNLKILGLKIEHCFNSVDFVMNLEKLEHLRVDLTKMNDVPVDKIVESVQFHENIYNLKNSNIWELLPNLKTVMARTDRLPDGPSPLPLNPSNWQFCTRGQATNLLVSDV